MCRSIKVLNQPGQEATAQETHDAALQYVRKISGMRKPSRANQAAFDAAVAEIAEASRRLLEAAPKKELKLPTHSVQADGLINDR